MGCLALAPPTPQGTASTGACSRHSKQRYQLTNDASGELPRWQGCCCLGLRCTLSNSGSRLMQTRGGEGTTSSQLASSRTQVLTPHTSLYLLMEIRCTAMVRAVQ
eukprot:2513179-Rhodomonas_salina.1